MEIEFRHKIVFSNQDGISVTDVANSLLANEQLVLNVGKILEYCFEGLIVEKVDIDFQSATINSPLTEELGAKLIVQFQDAFKAEVPALIAKITGVHIDQKYGELVTTIFLIIVIYGVKKACELFKSPKEGAENQPVPQQIIQNYGILLNAGGDITGIAPETLEAAVEKTFPSKRIPPLAKAALSFIQPAKREKGAGICGAGLSIDPATIEAAPSAIDIAMDEDEERQTPYEKQQVVIHANDRDHSASGWAGHIVGVWDKRLRMKLFPAISPASLFGKELIVADIIVVSKRHLDGEYRPYMFHVIDVYE